MAKLPQLVPADASISHLLPAHTYDTRFLVITVGQRAHPGPLVCWPGAILITVSGDVS